ncbi:MAG: hypothetical protein IJ203_13050 [Atopobiaceae bacterium]|nr:hypothetical protein [Atopobiaceae bacterium]MBR1829783.1 hypothetical protein [Atopobiaceae bacterium]
MSGFYHQDERDGAAAGCAVLVLAVIAAVVLSVVLCSLLEGYEADPKDGSSAGANAVTLEELERHIVLPRT